MYCFDGETYIVLLSFVLFCFASLCFFICFLLLLIFSILFNVQNNSNVLTFHGTKSEPQVMHYTLFWITINKNSRKKRTKLKLANDNELHIRLILTSFCFSLFVEERRKNRTIFPSSIRLFVCFVCKLVHYSRNFVCGYSQFLIYENKISLLIALNR